MAEIQSNAPVQLKKQIGLLSGVAINVGIIVGSGIFVSPKGVLMTSGSIGACLLVWTICGILCMAGAMSYAELGTCIPTSGGEHGYLKKSMGDLPAFLFLWASAIALFPTGMAISALTFAYYVLQPIFPDCKPPERAVTLLAALCICTLTFVNCRSVAWATRVQNIFTCTKVLALVIIILVGMVKLAMGSTENFENSFEGTTTEPGQMALAFYSGLFSYSGWNFLNFVTEEMKDPYKNLPKAIYISLPLVTIIYILANIAYFVVMTPAEMIASDAVAVTFSSRTLGPMAWVMPLFVACSTFGSVNGCLFTSSRLYFVGARHGHLPAFLATINLKYMTPLPSLVLGCVVSLIMLCSSDVYALINYAGIISALFIGLTVTGLLVLRCTHPDMKRPIKVNLIFPIFFLLVSVFLVVFPFGSSPRECLMGIVIILTGIPVYALGVLWKNKPKVFVDALESFSKKTQYLFLAGREEVKEN